MFNRFTERARKVIVYAKEEARRFNHDYIGTEHLLLGLVREGEGVAAAVRQLGRERPVTPEPLGTTFEDDVLMSGRQRMTKAFDEGVTNLRAQIEYVKEQVKLNAASSQKFADEDEIVCRAHRSDSNQFVAVVDAARWVLRVAQQELLPQQAVSNFQYLL